MTDNWVTWVIWIVLIAAVVALIILNNREKKKLEEKRLREIQEAEEKRLRELKEVEEKRVNEIVGHKNDWGETMCQWLIENKYALSDERTKKIMDKFLDWGQGICQKLLEKKLEINYTVDMVRTAFGEPANVDEKTITEREEKYRWIYGRPRLNATYIWFKNGKVTKIKQ